MKRSKSRTSSPPFAGKAVLVTGGSRGVGAAIARAFAAAGAKVAINYRRSRKEASAVAASFGGVALQGDVARQADKLIAGVLQEFGQPASRLYIVRFTDTDELLGAEPVEDPATIIEHGIWRDAAWQRAVPYREFVRATGFAVEHPAGA